MFESNNKNNPKNKGISGLIDQLRVELNEFVGKNTIVEENQTKDRSKEERASQKTYQRGAGPNERGNGSFTLDVQNVKGRAARAVIISAATIYAWTFMANPIVFLGFVVAVFDLLVGFRALLSWFSETVSIFKERRQQNKISGPPAWVERTEMYRRARERFQETIRVASAGVALPGSPTTKARKYFRTMIAIAPAMILAAGVAAAFIHPALILLAIAPAVILVVPILTLKLKKAERGEIDEEIPFFLILAEMFAFIERPLVQAFDAILSNKGLLTKMRKEAEIVRRDVSAFGYTPAQALDNLAKNHPNPEFRQILRGYLSSVALGQSASSYLQNKAELYLARLESKYERFKDNVGTAGELMLIALMIVPVTGMMLGTSGGMSNLVLAGSIPLIGIAVFFMLDKAQVKGPPIRFKPQIIPVIIGALAAVIATLAFSKGADLVTILLIAVAAFAIPHGIVVRRKLAREDSLLSELSEFIRTIAEGMKTGLDVVAAIRYTKIDNFNTLQPYIRRVQFQLARGETLAAVGQEDSHFHIKYAMFVMSELASSGAASFAMLDRLAEYLGRVREYTNKTKKAVAVYGFLVVSAPLFMVFTTHSMQFMVSALKPQSKDTAQAIPAALQMMGSLKVQDASTIQLTLLFTTLCAGALGGKIANQTLRDTVPLGIACILALVSPMLVGMIWPL